MSKDLYIEISAHFGIESVENLIADRRNRFINRYSGGHTGGASGAVHQGPRPLGAHQRGPDDIFFEKLISSVSHVASHSGYCREIVF